MRSCFITVILLLRVNGVRNGTCSFKESYSCNNSSNTHPATVCKNGNSDNVTIICGIGNVTYTCQTGGSYRDRGWKSMPDSSCFPEENTGTPASTTKPKSTTLKPFCTSEASSSQSHGSSDTHSTTRIQMTTTTVNQQSTSEAKTSPTKVSPSVTEEATSNPDDNESTSESPIGKTLESSDSDDKATVVAAAVSVSVVAVILVVLIVVFLLWRKKRQKSTPAAGLYSGNSLTNRSYEDRHGLDRHISLLNIRSNQSVDSGYTEIPLENLRSEETTGNVYQTIDILPDDQIECNGNYGHLEMKTTAFVDNNYSHIPIKQANGNVQQDPTYAHTGGATLKPDMENKGKDSENTYNILETMPDMTIRGQEMDNVHKSNTDENESEYNHATAGRSDSSGSKADTYHHLNRTWQNRPANPHNDMKPISGGGENQSHNSKGKDRDFDRANDEKNIPEYAKCIKKKKDTENPRQVGSDGYEKASGIAHEYFVLEPDNSTADNETSFCVIEDNCVDNPDDTGDAENPYHQYFTLEKTNL